MEEDMPRLVMLLALALLTVWAPHNAQAQHPRMIQTACDTLSHDPPIVRFTFAVKNDDPLTAVSSFRLEPGEACFSGTGPCCIQECAAPEGWLCIMTFDGEVPNWVGPGVNVGERRDGFSFVTDLHSCCYQSVFLDQQPPGPASSTVNSSTISPAALLWEENVCFTPDQPVAARAVTWGSLKAVYR